MMKTTICPPDSIEYIEECKKDFLKSNKIKKLEPQENATIETCKRTDDWFNKSIPPETWIGYYNHKGEPWKQ